MAHGTKPECRMIKTCGGVSFVGRTAGGLDANGRISATQVGGALRPREWSSPPRYRVRRGGGSPPSPMRVRCGNLVTPPDGTRERHRRDGRGAPHDHYRLAIPLQSAVVAPVARAQALDEVGDDCSDRRTPSRSARGAAGSELAADRNIPTGGADPSVRMSGLALDLEWAAS